MKKIIALFLFAGILFAKTVVVTGVGNVPEQAKKNALRQAVEQVVGADMQSKTVVKNGKLDFDKIISNTNGLIQNYKQLDQYKENDVWYVTLRVSVNPEATKSLKDTIRDRRAMRSFQDANFKNRSVLVLYSNKRHSLSQNSMAVQELLATIQDKLRDKEFDIILPDDLDGMSKIKLEENIIDEEDAINYGRMAKADAIVLATINAGSRKTDDGYYSIYAKVMLRAYDPTSKRLFANVIKRGKTIANSGSFGLEDGAARAAGKVAKKAVNELIEKIVSRCSSGSKQWVVVKIANINEDEQDSVLDALDKIDMQYKISRQSRNTISLKVNSDMSATGLRRVLKKAFRKNGVSLRTVSTQGDAITFDGE